METTASSWLVALHAGQTALTGGVHSAPSPPASFSSAHLALLFSINSCPSPCLLTTLSSLAKYRNVSYLQSPGLWSSTQGIGAKFPT